MELAQITFTTATEVQPHNNHIAIATKESLQTRENNTATPQPLDESSEDINWPRLVVSSDEEDKKTEEGDNFKLNNNIKSDTVVEDKEIFEVAIRKRYEVSRLGSEEILLGCNEIDGEVRLVSESEELNMADSKTQETTSSETYAPAAKRLKKSPEKYSPRREETKRQQGSKQEQSHIVGDAEEIKSYPNNTVTLKTRGGSGAINTGTGSKILSAQDDFYKKPFEYGWKRELVWRATPESGGRGRADVYFISPAGKKIRTRHDIPPLLTGELTMEHFCWLREPVGVAKEFETVRTAKPNPNRASVSTSYVTNVAASTPSTSASAPVIGKRMPKPKGPKGASPPPEGWTPTRALKVNNAALNSKSSSFGGFGGSTTPSSRATSNTATRSASNKKKYANDLENDLKQINESIRNSLPTQPALAKLEAAQLQQKNAIELATVMQQQYARNVFGNMSYTFDSLLIILKYLKIHERMRFASVCKMWHAAANSRFVWQTVRLKNSKVFKWSGCAAALQRNGTKHLDMRKMLFPSAKADETWADFSKHIGQACFLEMIDLCRCPAKVVESLFQSNYNLRVLNAITINDDAINLEHINNLTNLEELRLRTNEPAVLTNDLQPLTTLTKLTHLSLTGIRSLDNKHVESLQTLTSLRQLELGECGGLSETFAEVVLIKLTQLQRLRLENGQDTAVDTLGILDALATLTQLTQLELVNFDVRPGFEERLKKCLALSKLLIIPTYLSQSATTNQTVLEAVQGIAPQLKVFTWGVTVELLRVTALYVDQCDESSKKEKHNFDECIPVLKPVPGAAAVDGLDTDMDNSGSTNNNISTAGEAEAGAGNDVPQIEILPLDKVERILAENMPSTKFQIVKLPYHATCKQQLVE